MNHSPRCRRIAALLALDSLQPFAKELLVNCPSLRLLQKSILVAGLANAVWILIGTSLLPSCGSSGDSLDKACAVLAQAQCERRQLCTNTAMGSGGTALYPEGVYVMNTYGDMATCLARQQLACMNNGNAPGTGTNPTQLENCASEYGTWSCVDLFDGNANSPPDCAPAGKLANGQPCAMAGQCASRFCAGTKNASCGLCADEPLDGAVCAASGCAPGQECKAESNGDLLCHTRRPVGDTTCTSDLPCQAFSTCVGASATDAAKTGVCTAASSALGAACGGSNPGCDGNLGLVCLGPNGAKTCQQIAYASAGSACGTLVDGARAECISADCFTTTGPASTSDTTAVCIARAADGAACDTQQGPICLAPARCVTSPGATSGTCTVPSAALCK